MSDAYTIGRLRGGFVLVFRDAAGRRHRHALGTTDAATARRLAPAIYDELTRPKGTSVEALWQGYVAAYAGRAIVSRMTYSWKALEARFARLPGDDIPVIESETHIAERRGAGMSDWTIYTELGHLRNVLTWAVKRGLIHKAPHIVLPSQPKPEEGKHFTRDEVRALIHAADTPHIKLAIVMLYTTAARKAAMLGLTWDRVDFATNRIDLRDPTIKRPHKGRAIVPILKTARPYLEEARAAALSNYVVEWAGSRVASIRTGLTRAGKLARLPKKVTPHLLRHSAAVHMAEDSVDMEVIRQFLGHSSIETTRKIYARYSPTYLAKAAAALEIA